MNFDRLKFRVWDKYYKMYIDEDNYPNNQEFVDEDYGNLIQSAINHLSFYAEEYKNRLLFEQCTGIKDKDGKLIYEGDIIYPKYVIERRYDGYMLPTGRQLDFYNGTCQIVGNRHIKYYVDYSYIILRNRTKITDEYIFKLKIGKVNLNIQVKQSQFDFVKKWAEEHKQLPYDNYNIFFYDWWYDL